VAAAIWLTVLAGTIAIAFLARPAY
jgi:hypothetical protein